MRSMPEQVSETEVQHVYMHTFSGYHRHTVYKILDKTPMMSLISLIKRAFNWKRLPLFHCFTKHHISRNCLQPWQYKKLSFVSVKLCKALSGLWPSELRLCAWILSYEVHKIFPIPVQLSWTKIYAMVTKSIFLQLSYWLFPVQGHYSGLIFMISLEQILCWMPSPRQPGFKPGPW